MRANVGHPRHKLRRWTRDPSALKGPPAEGGGELALARTGRSSVPTREKAGTANKRRAGARPDSRGRLSPRETAGGGCPHARQPGAAVPTGRAANNQ